jgi:S-adenosylmethionine:tRNA ribosyltransferase-isomerase
VRVSDFDYALPEDRIAQVPLERRDASRLMVLGRESGSVKHRRFADLPDLLASDDLLVVNDTRVIPARLWARKATGGRVELLLLERLSARPGAFLWRCLVRASRSPKPGSTVEVGGGLSARLVERQDDAWVVELRDPAGNPDRAIDLLGQMPLPPYIRRAPDDARSGDDRERYQTVYARAPGAVAAPTAGLHFTPELIGRLGSRGIRQAVLTLHVGPGTFQPVRVEEVEEHRMHSEAFELPDGTAAAIDETRRRGGKVVAVGTTVVRVLEAMADDSGRVRPGSGRCELFIYPGFRFRVVDHMITNFHLPRSTLLMLVSAFAGRENVLSAYGEAVREGYRFYSYGDAMLLRSAP